VTRHDYRLRGDGRPAIRLRPLRRSNSSPVRVRRGRDAPSLRQRDGRADARAACTAAGTTGPAATATARSCTPSALPDLRRSAGRELSTRRRQRASRQPCAAGTRSCGDPAEPDVIDGRLRERPHPRCAEKTVRPLPNAPGQARPRRYRKQAGCAFRASPSAPFTRVIEAPQPRGTSRGRRSRSRTASGPRPGTATTTMRESARGRHRCRSQRRRRQGAPRARA
jgi:hypothetical protein